MKFDLQTIAAAITVIGAAIWIAQRLQNRNPQTDSLARFLR